MSNILYFYILDRYIHKSSKEKHVVEKECYSRISVFVPRRRQQLLNKQEQASTSTLSLFPKVDHSNETEWYRTSSLRRMLSFSECFSRTRPTKPFSWLKIPLYIELFLCFSEITRQNETNQSSTTGFRRTASRIWSFDSSTTRNSRRNV